MTDELQYVSLQSGSWCGDKTFELPFPKHWKITQHTGNFLPSLSDDQIQNKFNKPVDGFLLSALLSSDKKLAIVIDDHTRPTPAFDILKPILSEAKKAAIPDENIKVIVALGTHVLVDKSFMRNKLFNLMDGDIEIVFPNCSDSNESVLVGHSNRGIPVFVNKHFANADIKIAVSGIYPHDEAGFSGGAKILIGVLGLQTLSMFHRKYGLIERGSAIGTDFRSELEHFADLVGLSYSINCIINSEKKIAELYCGDFRKAFKSAAKKAQTCFGTQTAPEADIVIANSYPLDTSLCVLGKSTWPFNYSKADCFKVIITSLCDCSDSRMPFSSSKKESNYQRIKNLFLLPYIKRFVKNGLFEMRLLFDPDHKWDKKCVIYISHIQRSQKHKPSIVNNCHVEYEWMNVLEELQKKMGNTHTATVAIFLYTPLLFPEINDCSCVDS